MDIAMSKIGEKLNWNGMLGMVIDIRGGLVFFGTSHHSLVKMGFIHFDAKPLSEDDKIILAGYEYDAELLGVSYPTTNDVDLSLKNG